MDKNTFLCDFRRTPGGRSIRPGRDYSSRSYIRRAIFESRGFQIQEWEKLKTDTLEIGFDS